MWIDFELTYAVHIYLKRNNLQIICIFIAVMRKYVQYFQMLHMTYVLERLFFYIDLFIPMG